MLQEYLTKEYIKKLDVLHLELTRKIQNAAYSGARRSGSKGSSLEFSDFREYAAGDDLRRVDWNSYARFDKLFLKLFMEEKQATVNIIMDCSASMMGEEQKGLATKLLAASLGYITLKNTDRLNFFGIGGEAEQNKKGMQSMHGFPDYVSFLGDIRFQGSTKLNAGIKLLQRERLGNGLCIIISDFFSEDNFEDGIKMLQYQHQDIILVQLLAKEERNPSLHGNIRLVDAETKEGRDIEVSGAILQSYKKALLDYETRLKSFCKKRNGKFVQLTAEDMPLYHVQKILT